MSCSKRTDNRSLFYAMAKDLYKDQNIASNFLDTINVSSFNKEEQMYGELLKIQATDLTDHDIKPYEKNISRIINYMQNKKDYTFLKLLKFRMWFKYGLKAQKLLAQGIALGIMAISKAPCKGKSFVYCQVFESFCPYRATGLRP